MSVYAHNLVTELERRGHSVALFAQYRSDEAGRIVYGGGPPPQLDHREVIGIPASGEVHGDFEADIDVLVRRVLMTHEPTPFDVLHAQYGYPPGLAALEAGRILRLPVVISIQGGDGHWVGTCCSYHQDAMRSVLACSDAILIGSQSFKDEVVTRFGKVAESALLVPTGIDVALFKPRKRPVPLNGRLTILYHGRIDERKGVFDLLSALGLLGSRRDWCAVFSGAGPDLDRLRAAVATHAEKARIKVLGPRSYFESPEIYQSADIFVSPSYGEGFSNTVLEAMATGLPIVSTRVTGIIDCIRDGQNGLLVPTRDPSALAAAVTRLLSEHSLRASLATAATEEAVSRYSWSRTCDAVLRVYANVITAGPNLSPYELPAVSQDCRFREHPELL